MQVRPYSFRPKIAPKAAARVRRTLEKAGLVFIDPDQEFGPGVRLREGRKT